MFFYLKEGLQLLQSLIIASAGEQSTHQDRHRNKSLIANGVQILFKFFKCSLDFK